MIFNSKLGGSVEYEGKTYKPGEGIQIGKKMKMELTFKPGKTGFEPVALTVVDQLGKPWPLFSDKIKVNLVPFKLVVSPDRYDGYIGETFNFTLKLEPEAAFEGISYELSYKVSGEGEGSIDGWSRGVWKTIQPGEPLSLSYSLPQIRPGNGSIFHRRKKSRTHATHTVEFEARDNYGGHAKAEAIIEVRRKWYIRTCNLYHSDHGGGTFEHSKNYYDMELDARRGDYPVDSIKIEFSNKCSDDWIEGDDPPDLLIKWNKYFNTHGVRFQLKKFHGRFDPAKIYKKRHACGQGADVRVYLIDKNGGESNKKDIYIK